MHYIFFDKTSVFKNYLPSILSIKFVEIITSSKTGTEPPTKPVFPPLKVELVSKALNHFGVIACLFWEIGGHM